MPQNPSEILFVNAPSNSCSNDRPWFYSKTDILKREPLLAMMDTGLWRAASTIHTGLILIESK